MSTAAADGSNRGVSIGRILGRAFGTLSSNPMGTLGVAFLISALPSLLYLYLAVSLQGWMPADMPVLASGMLSAAIGIFLSAVPIVLWSIAQGALVRPTVAFAEGGKAGPGESLAAALRVAIPLFLLALLGSIALLFGFLLLVVPGLMLYVMWSAAVPSLVVERLGPIEAFGRSRELTRGARWRVFGLLLTLLVLYWLFAALTGLVGVAAGSTAEFGANAWADLSATDMGPNLASSTLTAAVGGVIHASLYVELRDWKDGPRTESLAEIFA
jgi:hypothetical protein